MMRRVVRVELGGRQYSYRCSDARKGDLVVVETPYGREIVPVVGYGRRGYLGQLSYARRAQPRERYE